MDLECFVLKGLVALCVILDMQFGFPVALFVFDGVQFLVADEFFCIMNVMCVALGKVSE